MFKRYLPRVADAVKECPEAFANKLFSKELIARETWHKVLHTQGLAPYDKASILLSAVERTVATSKDDKALKKFCRAMSKLDNLRRFSKLIMKRCG